MDFLQNATDDQIALIGCFMALVTSAALMYVSVFLSRSHRKIQVRNSTQQALAMANKPEIPATTEQRKVA
jgi:hypothetical protein